MQVLQGRSPTSPRIFSGTTIHSVPALCNIALGKKLLVHHGKSTSFMHVIVFSTLKLFSTTSSFLEIVGRSYAIFCPCALLIAVECKVAR